VSVKNPAVDELIKKGVRKQVWTWMYVDGIAKTWDDVTGVKIGKPVHLYTRSDSCGAAASWASYMGKKQEDLKGVGVYGDPGLLEAAKTDPLGIGYTNFSYIFTREGKVVEGAVIVPIDANGNGKADPEEIYNNRAEAVKAIESGKYPVTRKNYFFIKGSPSPLVKEFIGFCLSDGGSGIVDEVGTSLPLPREDRDKELKSLE
jgi:phosphate transport system substrate-binding protein